MNRPQRKRLFTQSASGSNPTNLEDISQLVQDIFRFYILNLYFSMSQFARVDFVNQQTNFVLHLL